MKASVLIIMSIAMLSCGSDEISLDRMTPSFGLVHGGDRVRFSGENLKNAEPFTVYFGNDRATHTGFEDDDTLWVNTPEVDAAKTVTVRVIGKDGTTFVIENGFQFVRTDKMAECVNISKAINGTATTPLTSKR